MGKKKDFNSKINKTLTADEKAFLNHMNSEYGFSVAKKLLEFKTNEGGFRLAGTPAENEAANWIREEMQQIGLKGVTKESLLVDAWEFNSASVEVLSPYEKNISMEAGPFTGIQGTPIKGLTGDVVYVGEGLGRNYEGIDVNDKIVLIDTNAYHTFWYNVIFEQAEARGAKAIIATVTDLGPGTYSDNLITVQDIQGFVSIPAVMLNKRDGKMLRELLKKDIELSVRIQTDIKITNGAEAHYVYGTIPGKNPESQIMIGGHYDAYWGGFQDNASSLGSMLTIAKAMIDSGFEPENTFVFVTNGAEEFGKAGTYFDYCIGSTAMMKDHPEWIRNTLSYTNFELTAINQNEELMLTVTGCYNKFFDSIIEKLLLEKDRRIISTRMAGADHIVFAKAGIPSCMNIGTSFVDSNPESVANYDHTQYDNIDRYNPDVFDFNNRLYGLINIMLDRTLLMQFDLAAYTEGFWKEVDIEKISTLYSEFDAFDRQLNAFTRKAKEIYEACVEVDSKCKDASVKDGKPIELRQKAWNINKTLLNANRIFLTDIYKYNAFTELIYGYKQPFDYVESIDQLIEGLELGQVEQPLAKLEALDNNYMISIFDKEVYEKTAIHAFDNSVPQQWGEGATLKFPNLYDVVASIHTKMESDTVNYDEEIIILGKIRAEQYDLLVKTLDDEFESVKSAYKLISEIELHDFL